MNITVGHGGSAWAAQRMSFEVHDGPPWGAPDEVFDAAGITVELALGCVGTLRSGSIGAAKLSAAWVDRLAPRMLRVRLSSEHGAGYIASARATARQGDAGQTHTLTLSGIEQALRGALVVGTAYNLGSLAPGGAVLMAGGSADFNGALGETRGQAIDRGLSTLPDGEWGVTADLTSVVGVGRAAPAPAVYTLDSRAYNFRNLGYVATDYVTDAVWSAGDGYPVHTWQRPGVPPLLERRTARATAEPATVPDLLTVSGPPYGEQLNTDYNLANGQRTWILPADIATPGPGHQVRGRAYVQARISVTPGANPIGVLMRLTLGGQEAISQPETITQAGIYNLEWQLPEGTTGAVEARLGVGALNAQPGAADGTVRLLDYRIVLPTDRENLAAVRMLPGWDAPFAVGPVYEFSLPGVHVPPLRVDGLPGGGSQYAAGVVITWRHNEASTKILTGALPYPGQRRGA